MKVFGEIAGDPENSLSYSPSPMKIKKKGLGLRNITNTVEGNSGNSKSPARARVLPFGEIEFTNKKPVKQNDHKNFVKQEIETKQSEPKKHTVKHEVGPKKETRFLVHDDNAEAAISDSNMTKTSDKPVTVPLPPIKQQGKQRPNSRRNRATEAQNAILKATESVNETLNASRAAKQDHFNNVSNEVAKLRAEWLAEKEEATKFYTDIEKTKREMLELRSQLSSQYAQNKADNDRLRLQKRLNDIDREIKFKSDVYVEHKKKLKDQADKRRRMSTALKKRIFVEKMEATERIRLEKLIEEHERLELKWEGERDAEEYKKKCEEERRQSLVFRGRETVRQRMEEEERKVQELNKKHESYELKWEGERDAEEYKKKCEEERRQSLAFRGREHVRHRAVMEELKCLAKEQENESYVLKWAAQDDVKEYLERCAEERRRSLVFRNKEGKRHRDLKEQWRLEELDKAHEHSKVQSDCQKDVEEFKRKCSERDRSSFIYRGKELQIQKMELEKIRDEETEKELRRRELDDLARKDVDKYVEDCKKRRRQSLAFRAKESRRHMIWNKQKQASEIENRRNQTRARGLDLRYVELAKEKERAQIALDALRHAKCTFSSSRPFGPLLG